MARLQEQSGRLLDDIRAYYASGDERSLAPVLDYLPGLLGAYVRGRLEVYDTGLIAEIVSNAMLELLKAFRAKKINPDDNPWAYACVAAQFELKAHHRRQALAPSRPGVNEDPFLLLDTDLAAPADDLPANAEDERRAATTVALATRAMLGLDPNARACVHLHYYKNMPVEAAAAHLGIDAKTFRARLSRGMEALRAWARQNPGLALSQAQYETLPRVNTGQLFEEDDSAERRRLKRQVRTDRSVQKRKRRIADVGHEQVRAEESVKERARKEKKRQAALKKALGHE